MEKIDKRSLNDLYTVKRKTYKEISDMFGCSVKTVYEHLKKYDISVRFRMSYIYFKQYNNSKRHKTNKSAWNKGIKKPRPDKKLLEKLYFKDKLHLYQIAEKLGQTRYLVQVAFKEYGIKSRPKGGRTFFTADAEERRLKSWRKTRKGKSFIPWNKGLTKETDERMRKLAISLSINHADFRGKKGTMYGKKQSASARRLMSLKKGGTGIPYEFTEYGSEWTPKLREHIRNRDNYTCQLSGMTEEEHLVIHGRRLDVHHINYDKRDCRPENLISLSMESHRRTNCNRKYWKLYFTNIINLSYLKS